MHFLEGRVAQKSKILIKRVPSKVGALEEETFVATGASAPCPLKGCVSSLNLQLLNAAC